MVAELGLLDDDMVEAHAIEDVAREFAAGAREIGPLIRVLADDALDPHLRQERQGKGEAKEEQHDGQVGDPQMRRASDGHHSMAGPACADCS